MNRTRAAASVLAAAALALPLAVTGGAAPAGAATTPVVPSVHFGMIQNSIATKPVPAGVGSVRLWDVGTKWFELQPTQAAPDFAPLDLAVDKARAGGVKDIMYVFGSTPTWAQIPSPDGATDLFLPGAASHPAKDTYYLDFVKAVVTRYKGRITSYQLWNEANLKSFYRGTPTQLATLCKKAYFTIKALDPKAKVVSPSWLLRSWAAARDAQLVALKAAGWPFDVASVHTYPFSTEGPNERASRIKKFQAKLASLGAKKPVWDTEVNYGDQRPGYPFKVYTGITAAGMVARTYIDSMRYGIGRTYWYSWDAHMLGIDMVDAKTDQPTLAYTGFRTARSWMLGSKWLGCTTSTTGVNRCKLTTATGGKRSILWATGTLAKTTLPSGSVGVCDVLGACKAVKAGQSYYLTGRPVFLKGA